METTEIANAFLSRAGSTTKYMTSAQRIDAITDFVPSHNEDKHLHMPDLLAKRLRDAQRRIPVLERKLDSLLHEHGIDHGPVDVIVDKLRVLAMPLSSRDTQANGTDLENATEMVSDSCRARRSAVANTASSSKMRNAARKLMTTNHMKLERLLARYRRETRGVIAIKDAEEGCFPWHAHAAAEGTMCNLRHSDAPPPNVRRARNRGPRNRAPTICLIRRGGYADAFTGGRRGSVEQTRRRTSSGRGANDQYRPVLHSAAVDRCASRSKSSNPGSNQHPSAVSCLRPITSGSSYARLNWSLESSLLSIAFPDSVKHCN